MKKKMIMIISCIVLATILLSGCEEKKSIYIESCNDGIFHSLIIKQSKEISGKLDYIITLLNLESWDSLEKEYDDLKDYIIICKNEIVFYSPTTSITKDIISLPWGYVKIDYDAYLYDMNWYAYYGSMGAFFMQMDDYSEGQNYFQESNHQLDNAMIHFEDCTNLINSMQS